MSDFSLAATFARLLLQYDPQTGEMLWRTRSPTLFSDGGHSAEHICAKWNSRFAGKAAGTLRRDGYIGITINRRRYQAHRLAWLMHYGAWPTHEIDHIDGARSNNRLANLRAATHAENCQNIPVRKTNTTGFHGVYFDKSRSRFAAEIHVGGRKLFLGRFDSPAQAARAVSSAKAAHHPFHPEPRQEASR